MRDVTYATGNADEGIAALGKLYAVRKVRVAPEAPFSMRQTSLTADRLSVERLWLAGAPAEGLTDGTGVLRVGQVLSGSLTFTDGSRATPGPAPFLLPQRPYTSRWGDLDLLTVTLDQDAVQEHARQLLGDPRFRLDFTASHVSTPALGRYWTSTLAHQTRDVLGDEELRGHDLLRAEAFRSLATALLHAFPSTFLDRAAAGTGQRPAPSAVRRARAFVEEHVASDIGLAEIAEAARMSPRGLQAAFRRELGTTPTAYLRGARLDAARTDLARADPADGVTVAAVAARWGFGHAGRFAAAYRERFGESPALTLRT